MDKLTQGLALKIDELKVQAEPFLTDKAKAALAIKSLRLLKTDVNGAVTDQCVYIGARTRISELEVGIKKVADKINALAERGVITSCLSNFIKFDLSQEGTGYFNEDGTAKEQETLILCYVLVPIAIYEEIMADSRKFMAFKDGEIPE